MLCNSNQTLKHKHIRCNQQTLTTTREKRVKWKREKRITKSRYQMTRAKLSGRQRLWWAGEEEGEREWGTSTFNKNFLFITNEHNSIVLQKMIFYSDYSLPWCLLPQTTLSPSRSHSLPPNSPVREKLNGTLWWAMIMVITMMIEVDIMKINRKLKRRKSILKEK